MFRVRKLIRSTLGGLAVGVAAMLVGACGHADERKVARVGGRVITADELQHWVAILAAGSPASGEGEHLQDEVLEFLIRARWIEDAAQKDHVVVGADKGSELLAQVTYARRRGLPAVRYGWDDELGRYLASAAASIDDQLWLMNLSVLHTALEQRELEQAELVVARLRVVRYYRENRGRFSVPEHRDVALVEASSLAAMRKARRALVAGVSPVLVARRYSEGPYDPTGLKRHYTQGLGGVALDHAIFSATPHVVVGPLHVYWYYVFEVLRVEPSHLLALAEVEGKIRRTLAKRGLAARLLPNLARDWRSDTICSAGYLVGGCKT
jgi:foldase protein PrsA